MSTEFEFIIMVKDGICCTNFYFDTQWKTPAEKQNCNDGHHISVPYDHKNKEEKRS